MPPLRMIGAFEAVARLGSRAEAAAELNVTLGAVTKQLRALEQWLGVELFTGDLRNGSTMTLEGRRLAMAVTAGFDTIKSGVGELTLADAAPVELRILAPASLSVNWLMPCLPRLEQEAPWLRIRVHATHTGEDWAPLPHDAAIRRDGFAPEGWSREVLFQERLGAFAAPGLVTEGADLATLPLVEARTRAGELDRWLAQAGVAQVALPRQRFSHFYTAYEAAIAGQGVIVAPTILAEADRAAGRLVPCLPAVQVAGAQHALLVPVSSAAAEAVATFAAFLRRRIAETEVSAGSFF
ncbi:hypothetical protein BKE38_14750 [Pseudoroseomonas deserti]|uniref:HTH lysR-type domain-containing protein n=2 Tax=Teichococcus deserti TaxID=1817963 RepID=A0A1V2H0P7_9PROT|nr:hypothetical protein BKE38_14750 [Pseudoroseomonas deserti]